MSKEINKQEIIVTYNTDRMKISNGESWVYTDSLNLAEVLNTEHKEVLKRIRKILEDYNLEVRELNSPTSQVEEFIYNNTDFTYSICSYNDSQNKLQPYYKLSKDLLILVIFSFRKLENAQELQKLYIAQFNKMQKELEWFKARYLGIDVRNSLTDTIKDYLECPKWYVYANYTNLVYTTLYNKTANKIREENGWKKNENLRPHLSENDLKLVETLEKEISVLISYGLEYDKIKTMMQQKYNNVIHNLVLKENELNYLE